MPEHNLEQKQNGAERLILCRRAHASGGEGGDKRRHLALREILGMLLAVKDDEPPNPGLIENSARSHGADCLAGDAMSSIGLRLAAA